MKSQEHFLAAGEREYTVLPHQPAGALRMKLSSGLGFLIVTFALTGAGLTALAFRTPDHQELPNYDRRVVPALLTADATHQQALFQLQQKTPSLQFSRDRLLGTVRFVSTDMGFLPVSSAAQTARATTGFVAPVADPYLPIKSFLNENPSLFGHNAEILDNARIKRNYVTAHNGLRTVIWEQTVNNIPVFEGLLAGHITRDAKLVSVSSRFLPNAAQAAALGTPGYATLAAAPPISAEEAITKAAADLGTALESSSVTPLTSAEGAERSQRFQASQLRGEAYAKLVWLPMDRNNLRLCWRVVLAVRGRSELYSLVVDAQTGEVLVRRCLTNYLTDATYNVYTSDSPTPFSPGWPTPNTGQPAEVPRQLVTLSALNTNASPNGWIPDTGTNTVGNNVDAHLDRNNDDFADLPRPQSTNRVFDFPLDLTQSPLTYGNAAVVQLFYWNNWMHDRLYEFGFTEAAGNFQTDNLGRGGTGGDAVSADAQDGGGFNNANFATPPDGLPGRMQMYVFDGPNPDRDGDLDAEVVLHEYTHGLSNRLVGGGVGIFELQPAGMGEGWSDFYGLALLSEPVDDVRGVYAVGGYLTYRIAGLSFQENYYYGIRRYPYTTDLTRNPLTLKDIDPTQADPHFGVAVSPIFGGGAADEVHNMGEVWCVTLWDARANLIDKLGFDEGNGTILQLVTDGMKLSPPNPSYLEARDAIIQADEILTGGDNRGELWVAFAKRGMGFSARVPASFTTIGVFESYDLPPDVTIGVPDGILEISVNPRDRSVFFAGDTNSVFVRVTDGTPVSDATITATLSSGGTLVFRNDGVPPDVTASNSVYSASLIVPTNSSTISVTLVISAPNKTTSTITVTYVVIPPPPNDDFVNAIKVPVNGASYVSNNQRATLETGEPLHANVVDIDASLWWNWSSPITTNLLVDTAGSLFDTVIAVYTGNQLASLTPVVATNDVAGRRQGFINFTAQAGVSYKIAIASANSGSKGSLYLRFAPGGRADTNAPVLTIQSPRSGLVVATNRVTIIGSAFDPQPEPSGIDRIFIFVRANENYEEQSFEWNERDGPANVIESTNFTAIVALNEGLNFIRVSVNDIAGNVSTPVTLQVTYHPLDPVNDIFANAIELMGVSGVSSVNTLRATKEFGEPVHAGNAGGRSAWWFFRAPSDGTLFLSTTNSTFDTLLAVYLGERVNALTTVAANDDAFAGVTFSKITQAVRANEVYRIAVDGFDGARGALFLTYSFTPSVIYRLTVNVTPGGAVNVSSGEFAGGTPLLLQAVPDFGFEFAGWEGSLVSSDNPLSITINADTTLTARFRTRSFADGFESGDFDALPWTFGGDEPWVVQTDQVSFGQFAARSGEISHGQTSSLVLSRATPAGVGAFDLRVSSEAEWDRLEFYVNGTLKQRWSGDAQWQSYQFAVSAGINSFEWRYSKDFSLSAGLDAAFVDNFDLPTGPTALQLLTSVSGGPQIRLTGQSSYTYVIQASSDLLNWQPISTNVAINGLIQIKDPNAANYPVRFYRSAITP